MLRALQPAYSALQTANVFLSNATRSLATAVSNHMQLIKELREKSGAPICDVKSSLLEAKWDMDTAYDLLRKKGLAAAAKKSSRHAAEGLVGLAQSGLSDGSSSSSSAIVEINSETDFVAKTEVFLQLVQDVAKAALTLPQSAAGEGCEIDLQQVSSSKASELAKQLAMHVAGLKPQYLNRASVPEHILDHERQVLRTQASTTGKPEAVIARMVEGRLAKFYEETCLLDQKMFSDDSIKVQAAIDRLSKELGRRLVLQNFVRVQVGEGLASIAGLSFAEEVASMSAI